MTDDVFTSESKPPPHPISSIFKPLNGMVSWVPGVTRSRMYETRVGFIKWSIPNSPWGSHHSADLALNFLTSSASIVENCDSARTYCVLGTSGLKLRSNVGSMPQ